MLYGFIFAFVVNSIYIVNTEKTLKFCDKRNILETFICFNSSNIISHERPFIFFCQIMKGL